MPIPAPMLAPHPMPPPAKPSSHGLGDEIAALSAHLDAATYRLLDLIRDFDARGAWGDGFNGFRDCAHWLSWRIGWDRGTAREKVRVARALPAVPLIAAAFARGELSYSKVRVIRGRLEPEVGAVVMRALEAADEALYQHWGGDSVPHDHPDAERPSTGQRRADALALLAEVALRRELDPGAPGGRYQVVVHVDAAVLADAKQPGQSVSEDGLRVPAGTSQRLACDASRVVMRHDEDGNIVEVGARTRTIPPALRRAMQARDRGCQFPGCGSRRLTRVPDTPGLAARRRAERGAVPADQLQRWPRATSLSDCRSTRRRRCAAGWGSRSTSPTRSTSCIH